MANFKTRFTQDRKNGDSSLRENANDIMLIHPLDNWKIIYLEHNDGYQTKDMIILNVICYYYIRKVVLTILFIECTLHFRHRSQLTQKQLPQVHNKTSVYKR